VNGGDEFFFLRVYDKVDICVGYLLFSRTFVRSHVASAVLYALFPRMRGVASSTTDAHALQRTRTT
jgi:hypothetical protein